MEKYKGTWSQSVISISSCVLNIKEIDLKIARKISGTKFYDFNTFSCCSYKEFEEKFSVKSLEELQRTFLEFTDIGWAEILKICVMDS